MYEDNTIIKLNKWTQKFLACFMICLIITLPFYIGSVYAGEEDDDETADIVSVTATGKDGILGYSSVGMDDYILLTINIIYTENEVIPDQVQVRFNNGPALNPTECLSSEENIYTCTLQTNMYKSFADSLEYKVTLKDKLSTDIDTFIGTVVVDGYAPDLDFDLKKNTAQQKIEFEIDVLEKACDVGCGVECAGIASIELYKEENGEELEPFDTFTEIEDCVYDETISKTYDELGIATGLTKYCVRVTDMFGFDDDECDTINFDFDEPVIIDDSFKLEKDGKPLTFITAGEKPKVNIYLNITDNGVLSTSGIIADFSDLNTKKPSYKTKNPSTIIKHTEGSGEDAYTIYEAKWTNIILDNEEGYNAIVYVKDADGNQAESSFDFTLSYDEQPPTISRIYTDLNGVYLNNSNKNTIFVDIIEDQSGISKETIFLDLSDISGNQKVSPTQCEKTESGYITCSWNNTMPTAMISKTVNYHPESDLVYVKGEVEIHGDSTDLVGNEIDDNADSASEVLRYDGTAPVIVTIEVTSATAQALNVEETATEVVVPEAAAESSEAENADEDLAPAATNVVGKAIEALITNAEDEVIIINAEIREDGTMLDATRVFAQLNNHDLWPEPTPASVCTVIPDDPYNKTYLCVWELSTVSVTGTSYNFEISATDEAENTAKQISPYFRIYGHKLEDESVDFFSDTVSVVANSANQKGTDYKLNRNFLHQSTQTLFNFELDLSNHRHKAAKSTVHDFSLTSCTATLGEPVTPEDLKPVGIVLQTYPLLEEQESREVKEIIISIPQFSFEAVTAEDATKSEIAQAQEVMLNKELVVTCDAEIIQTNQLQQLVSPNEEFTLELTVPMTEDAPFTNPADSTLDKIVKHKKAIDNLDSIISLLDFLDFAGPYCKLISLIRQMANDIQLILEAGTAVFLGSEAAAYNYAIKADFLSKLWYGTQTPNTDNWNVHEFPSVGFICDLTLCSQCSRQWNTKIFGAEDGAIGSKGAESVLNVGGFSWDNTLWGNIDWLGGKEATVGAVNAKREANNLGQLDTDDPVWTGTSDLQIPLDPHKNFIVALICWPPCIPTILNTLKTVKQVYVAENTCLNKRYLLGEDAEDCGKLANGVLCVTLASVFASMLTDLLKQTLVKLVSSMIARVFELGCTTPGGLPKPKPERMNCAMVRVRNAILAVLALGDLVQTAKEFDAAWEEEFGTDFSWDFGSDDDEDAEDVKESQEEAFGDLPTY